MLMVARDHRIKFDTISKIALAHAKRFDETHGPYHAEIVPECDPAWYLIRIAPGSEHIASGHLIGRRFGVYLPMVDKAFEIKEGIGVPRGPLFPGYLFVFTWNALKHWRRIRACPGVNTIVLDGNGMPVVIEDSMIDKLQAWEFGINPHKAYEIPKRPRRRRRHPEPHNPGTDHITISTRSFWGTVAEELPEEVVKSSALHRALGLAA